MWVYIYSSDRFPINEDLTSWRGLNIGCPRARSWAAREGLQPQLTNPIDWGGILTAFPQVAVWERRIKEYRETH